MRVSVVATVYNEEKSIKTLMDSLLNQTRQPDEIVICDGGSTDDTVALLEEYTGRLPGLRVVADAGANISQGRNRAVAEAKGTIIACTDAGVRLDSNWLDELVAPFEEAASPRGRHVGAVAGFFVAEVSGPFQLAMGATVLP
ncbi:MAG: glycosyltransferase, partial [Caldilineaceae bacterium SB0675_bin_29]|nr:glycosyltransferase [Caldilineaceae bacterium SB0675_bin_29]